MSKVFGKRKLDSKWAGNCKEETPEISRQQWVFRRTDTENFGDVRSKQWERKSEREMARESSGLSPSHALAAHCGARWVSPNGRKAEASPTRGPSYRGLEVGRMTFVRAAQTHPGPAWYIPLSPTPATPPTPAPYSGPWSRQSIGQGSLVLVNVLITGWLWVRNLMSLGFSFPFEK